MSKQVELFCTTAVSKDGLFAKAGSIYPVRRDNHGEFFEDENGDEHYLADVDWERNFCLIV